MFRLLYIARNSRITSRTLRLGEGLNDIVKVERQVMADTTGQFSRGHDCAISRWYCQ